MINISRTFQVTAWAGNNAKSIFDGVFGDKYKVVETVTFQRYTTTQKRLKFDSAGKTITNINNLDTDSFIDDYEFKVGAIIRVPMSVHNNIDLTITAISDRVITVSNSLTTETLEVGYIFDKTPITGLEFLYNCIAPGEQENYLSNIDTGTLQKYIVSGISASDLVTVSNLLVGTKSFGWLADVITGQNSTSSTIVGAGFTGYIGILDSQLQGSYVQSFTITHYFVAPLGIKSQYSNFSKDVAPSIYPLSYISSVNVKKDQSGAIWDSGSSLADDGVACWLDQNNFGTVPEYSLSSIGYTDANGNVLSAIDLGQETIVTAVIKSYSGLFNVETNVKVAHFYLPLDENKYTNTTTTMLQNLFTDSIREQVGAAAANGSNYGTSYQVIQAMQAVYNSANEITVTFKVNYGSTIQNYLKGVSSNDRNYVLFITTEKSGGAGDNLSDRVSILADFNNCVYDQSDATLFKLLDASAYQFPDIGTNPQGTIAGIEGDQAYVEYQILVETKSVNGIQPIFEGVKVQVVAVKTGESDYIIEEWPFNIGNRCRYQGAQNISLYGTRGYKATNSDIYNQVNLFRDSDLDAGTMKGYILQYGLVLRYDNWNNIGTTAPGGPNCQNDINNDIENVNNAWSNLIQNGWTLVLRLYAEVTGYDGFTSEFEYDMPMNVQPMGAVNDTGNQYGCILTYWNLQNERVSGILSGTQTRVRAVFMPDGSAAFPTTYAGMFFADIPNTGGPTNARRANTERPSEAGSSWSDPGQLLYSLLETDDGDELLDDDGNNLVIDDAPDTEYCNGNVRIGIYKTTGIVVIESLYDDTVDNWSMKNRQVMIVPRLVPTEAVEELVTDDGAGINTDDGEQIQLD